jgi:hypothetical protein
MSLAWRPAAVERRRFAFRGLSPREVRSWLTRQSAEFASWIAEAWATGPSVEAQTVAAVAGPAPAATAVRRRRRGRAPLTSQVRIYPLYRVEAYPALASRHMF